MNDANPNRAIDLSPVLVVPARSARRFISGGFGRGLFSVLSSPCRAMRMLQSQP
jgi:hypothetical protein